MEDDKTVFMGVGPFKAPEADADRTVLVKPETLLVDLLNISGQVIANYAFENSFSVGRSAENSVVVNDQSISRHHLQIKREADGWWLYDLNSTHGVYLDKQRLAAKTKLQLPVSLGLGVSPFELKIASANAKPVLPTPKDDATLFAAAQTPVLNQPIAPPPKTQPNLSADAIKNRLLSEEESADMGDYTRMVRRVIREDRTVRTKNYKKLIWSLGILFVIAAGLVTYQYLALDNARKLAINMFYDVKTLEVSLSQADIRLAENIESLGKALEELKDEKLKVSQERIKAEQAKILEEKKRLAEERQKLKLMKAKYQEYLKEIDFLRLSFPTDEQYERELITRVVRGFGESELELPEEFVTQVRQYIKNWQDTGRLRLAIKNMQDNHYGPMVLEALDKEGLPAYFIYLPLQESNYDTKAIGPETRFGIAKGAWQFLATTGQEYGLPPGPLANVREYDEQDARFDFAQATQAGAKYLKYIYSKQAQASGLLVMASYNYGHNKVRGMVEKMPDNPRDRNFWKFIQQYEIPVETYDYVFYIVSAAVIGEDPKHFGFDFSPPLLQLTQAVN
ncbi:FHA domain-containing protein [Methylomonas sp. OY6]|uniref:FHA domain-containing protein n=1 Tax=Methylomonas defluvii TaxID=3045149 RepID=A0ABU4UAY4_9GAMM|nr:FHA domain-containing protein [Methylomonas sp. OY6]MDX8126040.1 FHA domain-containing protein [Methylomonas sp. OY6]